MKKGFFIAMVSVGLGPKKHQQKKLLPLKNCDVEL